MKVTLSEIYRCRVNGEAEVILEMFPKMVEWWIGKAGDVMEDWSRRPIRYSEFRNMHYYEWRRRFAGWNTHYAQTSSLIAYTEAKLRSIDHILEGLRVKMRFAVIHPNIAWIRDGCLKITTKPRRFVYVRLKPRDRRQRLLLEQAERGEWRIGQILLTGQWTLIPLLRDVELLRSLDPILSEIAQTG